MPPIIKIVAPVGLARELHHQLAPRPVDLAGRRLGVLSNAKQNADVLLGALAEWLMEHEGVTLAASVTKDRPTSAAPPDLLDSLAGKVDFVVTGPGD